jgi:AcrR family transcriptional regulator
MSRAKDPLAPVPEPTPHRSDSSSIVEAIVEAAVALGDPDASVNAIAARAGVGVASVYRYFPNKSAIYAEVSRRLQRDFLNRVRALLATPALSLEQAVEGCCRAAIEAPGVSPAIRRAVNLALPLSWSQDNAERTFSTAIDELTSWLSAHIEPAPPDLRERVFAAFAAGRGMVMMSRLMPNLAPSDEALVQHMARGAMAYLAGPPPAGLAHVLDPRASDSRA